MFDIQRALGNESVLRSLTGLRRKQFQELHQLFAAELLHQKMNPTVKRQRALGAGRPHTLATTEGMLFFILFYLKVYPTMELAGFLFGVAKSRSCTWVQEFQPILEAVLGKSHDLPKRKISTIKEFLEQFPDVEKVVIDGTERPRNRPKNKQEQRKHYSGKKKRHTIKNTILADPNRKQVLVLTCSIAGSIHDKKDLDNNELVSKIPEHIPIEVDLGYHGIQKERSGIIIPHKKPRNGELTPEQKHENRAIASSRVAVEHVIGLSKRYGCISQTYRNRRAGFDDAIMLTCCGMANFYQRTRIAA